MLLIEETVDGDSAFSAHFFCKPKPVPKSKVLIKKKKHWNMGFLSNEILQSILKTGHLKSFHSVIISLSQ